MRHSICTDRLLWAVRSAISQQTAGLLVTSKQINDDDDDEGEQDEVVEEFQVVEEFEVAEEIPVEEEEEEAFVSEPLMAVEQLPATVPTQQPSKANNNTHVGLNDFYPNCYRR